MNIDIVQVLEVLKTNDFVDVTTKKELKHSTCKKYFERKNYMIQIDSHVGFYRFFKGIKGIGETYQLQIDQMIGILAFIELPSEYKKIIHCPFLELDKLYKEIVNEPEEYDRKGYKNFKTNYERLIVESRK